MDSKGNVRGGNAFVRQIFDKKTGKNLMCHLHPEEGNSLTFSLGWWDEESISYDQVMKQTVAALRREKKRAMHVVELLETGQGSEEKASRMAPLTVEARKLFEAMAEIESPDLQLYDMTIHGELSETDYQAQRSVILEGLAEKDSGFSEIVEQMNVLKRAFSSRNPWIKAYSGIDVPDTLMKSQVKAWIDRILVDDLTTVEVVLPESYAWWKRQLPANWLEVEL